MHHLFSPDWLKIYKPQRNFYISVNKYGWSMILLLSDINRKRNQRGREIEWEEREKERSKVKDRKNDKGEKETEREKKLTWRLCHGNEGSRPWVPIYSRGKSGRQPFEVKLEKTTKQASHMIYHLEEWNYWLEFPQVISNEAVRYHQTPEIIFPQV